MEVFDLKPFNDFIQARQLVPEKYLAYYVGWVRRFLQTEIPSVMTNEKDRLRFFCEQLERGGRAQEWQVDQARRAVELYTNVFQKETQTPSASVAPAITDAEAACHQLRELLRVRHYSIHTEHTYLDWVRRFLAYAKESNQDWQADGTVRSFLAYLATKRDVYQRRCEHVAGVAG